MAAPAESLEEYLSRLTLQPIIHGPHAPPMPPPHTRSSMTPLTLKPAGYRRLEVVEPLPHIDRDAAQYFSKLADVDMEAVRRVKLGLPASEAVQPVPEELNMYIVNNPLNVVSLLSRFLFGGIAPLLGSIDVAMRQWKFEKVHRPQRKVRDSQSLDPIILSCYDASGHRDAVKFVLLPLAPWEFAPMDFHEFTTLDRFDDTPNDPNGIWVEKSWVNADRMRAHLYDLCLGFDCPYFAVTTHELWAFGSFSKCYTTAFISPPFSFDHQPTSVVEILLYWICAALDKPNTIQIPSIEEEENVPLEEFQKERELHAKRFVNTGLSRARSDSASDDCPPAKRQRVNEGATPTRKAAKQEVAKMVRRKHTLARYRKLCRTAEAKKRARDSAVRQGSSTGSIASEDLSTAPSCPEPLPKKLIPQRKYSAIQQWRTLVAIVEEQGEEPAKAEEEEADGRRWVFMPRCDPITGLPTGDLERVEDRACPSCGPSSPSLSSCSVSSEEVRRWNRLDQGGAADPDPFESLAIDQWHDW